MIALALAERPKLITIGGSLNLFEHPVADIRAIADDVGAKVMLDAAHRCGIIACRSCRAADLRKRHMRCREMLACCPRPSSRR